MAIPLRRAHKEWHKLWFYLKNDDAAPLLVFTGHLIEEAPDTWRYDPVSKEQGRLQGLL